MHAYSNVDYRHHYSLIDTIQRVHAPLLATIPKQSFILRFYAMAGRPKLILFRRDTP